MNLTPCLSVLLCDHYQCCLYFWYCLTFHVYCLYSLALTMHNNNIYIFLFTIQEFTKLNVNYSSKVRSITPGHSSSSKSLIRSIISWITAMMVVVAWFLLVTWIMVWQVWVCFWKTQLVIARSQGRHLVNQSRNSASVTPGVAQLSSCRIYLRMFAALV